MTPDRHLGAAWIDKCRPDVLITGICKNIVKELDP